MTGDFRNAVYAGDFQARQLTYGHGASLSILSDRYRLPPADPKSHLWRYPRHPDAIRRVYTNRGSLQASQGCVAMSFADTLVSSGRRGVSDARGTEYHDCRVGRSNCATAQKASAVCIAAVMQLRTFNVSACVFCGVFARTTKSGRTGFCNSLAHLTASVPASPAWRSRYRRAGKGNSPDSHRHLRVAWTGNDRSDGLYRRQCDKARREWSLHV